MNALQTILALIDENGQLVEEYTYNAYGVVTINKLKYEENINFIFYKGYYYDIETGLYYVMSRYYNPSWCRWLTPDSIDYLDPNSVNGLNLYCYCGNNPVNRVDPSGKSWWEWLIGGVLTTPNSSTTVLYSSIGVLNLAKIIYSYYIVNKYNDLDYSGLTFESENGSYKIDTTLLKYDKTIMQYVNYMYANNESIHQNWTKEQLYRELKYHVVGKNNGILNWIFESHLNYVDVELKQDTRSYVLRYFGNLLW